MHARMHTRARTHAHHTHTHTRQIESGKLELTRVEFDLRSLLEGEATRIGEADMRDDLEGAEEGDSEK